MRRCRRPAWKTALLSGAALAAAAALPARTTLAQFEPVFDDAFVAIPLEPDEAPYRPETPRPTPPATQPAAEPPDRAEPETESGDPIVRASDTFTAPLAQHGITPAFSLTADYGRVLRGGASTNSESFNHLLNFNLTFDAEALFGLRGGAAFASFQQYDGESATTDAGSYQGVSAIESDRLTQLSELWYQHSSADERVRVKVGKIDAGGEFAYALNGGEFVQSGVTTNVAQPTYPDPSFGGNVFVAPSASFYIGAGVYDGAAWRGVRTGRRGPRTLFGEPSDLYLIGEAGLTWDVGGRGIIGRLAAGAWHHTGTFRRFDGTPRDGATGWYAIFDQTLFRENPGDEDDQQGVGVFAIYDTAGDDVFDVDHHLAAGVAWTGAIPSRDADVFGIGVSWVRFNENADVGGDDETAIEAFYRLQITPYFSVKPDVQYIVNPSGGGADDALVATVRMELTF